MNLATHLLTLNINSETAVSNVIQRLADDGLEVVRSFDLKAASGSYANCVCPNHGTDQCDCQMVVLLIYDHHSGPSTVVAHGHNGQTHFSLVEPPEKDWERLLKTLIMQALAAEGFEFILEEWSNST